jgi:long-chain acyl-CoA synthetase
MKVGREANLTPNGKKGLQYKLANALIFSKLKPAIGMARARVCVSGAAPIAQEVLEFFASLDIVVLEVYGQSEDTGPTSFNLPHKYRFGSVGPAVDGVNVKIAEDGEILVSGPNVFQGYYKDEAATAEALVDGWLHSGDLGEFRDGFLYITGRKKDIIITAGGKNIAPKNIEAGLKNHELINEAVVIGDRRKYLTVVVTLDPEASEAWAKERGIPVDGLGDNPTLRAELQTAVDHVNTELARVEQIKKFKVLTRNLTVEDGELTPTLKVKRAKVYDHFSADIESMYEGA